MSHLLESVRVFIFDFDGTLAELNIDFPLMKKRIVALAARFGIDLSQYSRLYVLELVDAAAKIEGIKTEEVEKFRTAAHKLIKKIELEAARKASLLPGIREMLEYLRLRDVGISIITRNCEEAVKMVFPEIEAFCDLLLPRGKVRNVKPDKEHLLSALRFFGTAPAYSCVVGDHPMDVVMGKEAGAFAIGVLTGTHTDEELRAAGADLILPSAAHISQLIP